MKKSVFIAGLFYLSIIFFGSVTAENLENQTVNNQESVTVTDSQTIMHDDSLHQLAEQASTKAESEKAMVAQKGKSRSLIDFFMNGKFLAFLILMVVGLTLLLGRKVNFWVRIGMLLVAFALFGLDYLFPLHPSPMCATTKLFMYKFTMGQFFPAFLALFLAIIIPSLIGRKLFCGWVCPLGALQELINKIPHKLKWKQFNFTAFNAVRMTLLALFFLTFFAVKDQIFFLGDRLGADTTEQLWKAFSAYNIYEPINFFELLHWNVDTMFIFMMSILVVASLALYRPFCYLICPIGALSWLCEKIAPGRIRIDHSKCDDCGTCEEESPCPTIKPLREQSMKALPDCTSCGECIKSCPENLISFRFFR